MHMSQTINVLFLAAEAEPFVKVGGLGDVYNFTRFQETQ